MAITLKDVAKKAGVTVTTVSRVLNNRGYISDKTRKRVYQVMEELNYQPNEIARSLSKKKSNIIGVIIPTVSHPFFSELAFYLEAYAYQKGYKIMLCNSQHDPKKEKEYTEMLRGNQVDGIIMASHTMEVSEYENLDLPIVTFDRQIEGIPYICSDNYKGASLATNLLIAKGCKKLAYISGSLSLNLLANKRNEAFINIAQSRNIDYITAQTDINVFNTQQYEGLIRNLFKDHPDIDGIFASSDLIAANAIKVSKQLNKKIPEDIKVIGYDDIQMSSLLIPELTTIRQPIEEMSSLAIDLLNKQINDDDVEFDNILPVALIERQTT